MSLSVSHASFVHLFQYSTKQTNPEHYTDKELNESIQKVTRNTYASETLVLLPLTKQKSSDQLTKLLS